MKPNLKIYFYCLQILITLFIILAQESKTDCGKYEEFDLVKQSCFKCIDRGLIFYEGMCYPSCPQQTVPNKTKEFCTSCITEKKFYFNGNCVNDCPNYMDFDNTNICIDCKKEEFYYKRNCIYSCMHKTIIKINSFGKYYCEDCSEKEPFVLNNTCISSCPTGHESDILNNCINCKDIGKFYYNSKCVENCDGLAINKINNYCHECTSLLDLETRTCVDKCDKNKMQKDKTCVKCGSSKGFEELKYLQEGDCVEKCSEFHKKNPEIFECEKCDKDNKIYYEEETNECKESCGAKISQIDKYGNKSCKFFNKCQKLNKFLILKNNEEICIDKSECLIKEGYIRKNFECLKCFNGFSENEKCVEKCSEKFVSNEGELNCYECENILDNKCLKENEDCFKYNKIKNEKNNICENCPEGKFFQKNECKSICSYPLVPDYENMLCVPEKEKNDFECIDNNCNCESNEFIKGDQCNIILNKNVTQNYFSVIGDNDPKDKEFYLFYFELNTKINTSLFKFEDIENIEWSIFSVNPKREKFQKSYHESNILRIKRKNLISYLYEEDNNIKISLNMQGNNFNETESLEVKFPKNNKCKENDIDVSFKEIDDEEKNTIEEKLLNKVNLQLNDTRCENSDPLSPWINNYISYKIFYYDMNFIKFPLINSVREKNLTINIPEYSGIMWEITTKGGNIFTKKIINTNTNKNKKAEKFKNITTSDIKSIKNIDDRVNIINNYFKYIEKENFEETSVIVKDTLDKTLFGDETTDVDKKIAFDFTNNYIDTIDKFDDKTKNKKFTDLNDNFAGLSNKILSQKATIKRDEYSYMFKSVNNLVDKLKINRNLISDFKEPNKSDDQNFNRERKKSNEQNYKKLQNSLNNFMKDFSKKLNEDEKVNLEYPNIKLRVNRFCRLNSEIKFDKPNRAEGNSASKKENEISKNNEKNKKTSGECDYKSSSFCAEKKSFELFKEYLEFTKEASLSDLAFISNINNNELLDTDLNDNTTLQSTDSINFIVFDTKNNKTISSKKNFPSWISIEGKNEKINETICVSKIEFEKRDDSNYIFKDCKTYFDKVDGKNTTTICECETDEEVFTISNIKILNVQKVFQYSLIQYGLSN